MNNESNEVTNGTAAKGNGKVQVKSFRVNMPKWLRVLDGNHAIITHAAEVLKRFTAGVKTVADNKPAKAFEGSEFFKSLETADVDAAAGVITYDLVPHDGLYFKLLSDMTGAALTSDAALVAYIAQVSAAKAEYDKMREALAQVEQTGYGVVIPTWQSFSLEKPQIHQSGKNFGVKLRAVASSLHIVRVDVKSEVAPIIGSQQQSEEMLRFLTHEYENNIRTVWDTPIFGKSLESIVREDISNKSVSMPAVARTKMRGALTKIVNNGKGGVICILL